MNANFRGKGRPPPTIFGTRQVESLGYRMVKKIAEKFNRLSRVHQRHRQQTDGIAMASIAIVNASSRPLKMIKICEFDHLIACSHYFGQTVVTISRFWISEDVGSHKLEFLKFYIFNDPDGQEERTASLCQILSKSLKARQRYTSFRFFKMAVAAILNFRNLKIFNGRNGQEGRTASACQISSKSLEPRLRYNNFSIFPRWPPSAIWISNACVGTIHEGHLEVFITVQNLVGIDAVVLIICTFFDFTSLA